MFVQLKKDILFVGNECMQLIGNGFADFFKIIAGINAVDKLQKIMPLVTVKVILILYSLRSIMLIVSYLICYKIANLLL